MNEPATEALSVVFEREIPFPPEKIWRALTQSHLIAECRARAPHPGAAKGKARAIQLP
jgi:uncharacterized protein YndB with AHSA1/START domain